MQAMAIVMTFLLSLVPGLALEPAGGDVNAIAASSATASSDNPVSPLNPTSTWTATQDATGSNEDEDTTIPIDHDTGGG